MKIYFSLMLLFFINSTCAQSIFLSAGLASSNLPKVHGGSPGYRGTKPYYAWQVEGGYNWSAKKNEKIKHSVGLMLYRAGGRSDEIDNGYSSVPSEHFTEPQWVERGFFSDYVGINYEIGYQVLNRINISGGIQVDYNIKAFAIENVYDYHRILGGVGFYELDQFDTSEKRNILPSGLIGLQMELAKYISLKFECRYSFQSILKKALEDSGKPHLQVLSFSLVTYFENFEL